MFSFIMSSIQTDAKMEVAEKEILSVSCEDRMKLENRDDN